MTTEGYLIMSGIGLVSMIGAFAASRASGAKDVTDAAIALVAPLRQRLTEIELRVTSLERENLLLRAWGEHAYGEAIGAGGSPVPFSEYVERFAHGETT